MHHPILREEKYSAFVKRINEPWFSLIKNRRKTKGVCLVGSELGKIGVGDIVEFITGNSCIRVKIMDVTRYPTFKEFVSVQGVDECMPGLSMEDAVVMFHRYVNPRVEKRHGVIGFTMCLLKNF